MIITTATRSVMIINIDLLTIDWSSIIITIIITIIVVIIYVIISSLPLLSCLCVSTLSRNSCETTLEGHPH